jgi:hypothetical protein
LERIRLQREIGLFNSYLALFSQRALLRGLSSNLVAGSAVWYSIGRRAVCTFGFSRLARPSNALLRINLRMVAENNQRYVPPDQMGRTHIRADRKILVFLEGEQRYRETPPISAISVRIT